MLSKELAKKMVLVHPPEPRKNLLLASPSEGVYIGKTRFLHTPVFWDPRKLINPHIAILGITGSGKSLNKDETVIVRIDGRVKLIKIGQFVDELILKSQVVSTIDDLEGIPEPNVEVFSFDYKLKASWCKVLFAGRKPAPANQYHFETASGRKVTTTGDHNLVVLRDSKILMVKSTEVNTGDYVPLPRQIKYDGNIGNINLIEILNSNDIFVSGANNLAALAHSNIKNQPIDLKYDKYLRFYKFGRSIPLKYFKQLISHYSNCNLTKLYVKATKSKKMRITFKIDIMMIRII